MARVTIEDCLDQVDNRFALVMLAAKRARQILNRNGECMIDAPKNKEAVKALREIAAGKVAFRDDIAELLTGWNPRGTRE
ncbi:MAG: DNA-directed RNA polymerase subunit omega [Deltaproteobacteria bacterium HGW-Deltaproteobacteria-14]|jgi:DNA-directed RNA polymerase subunit omega|nr:MAG: DNA-directed RNA polymerase subunit omega [Deltaproteobacteria bacterium HGW-Deltaproteobacteria-14]